MNNTEGSVSDLLDDHDAKVRARWDAAVNGFLSRITQFLRRESTFDEVKRLLVELLALVEPSPNAVDGADSRLQKILTQLRELQARDGIGSSEMVFLLFSIRDIVGDAVRATPAAPGEEANDKVDLPLTGQVSALLNRLGLVLFESDVRAREEASAAQDVLALEYALLYERTRHIAITDQLTRLHNFGYFWDRLREEKARAERYQRLLSLIIIDLDHFKRYNDGHGHPAGNEVLKRIAEILHAEAREVDIVARYGGEELVILLPEATRRDATAMANRIRNRVWETHFDKMHTQPLGRISVSAGVATYPVDAYDESELVQRADESLYQAKAEGRNRVVSYLPPHRETLRYYPERHVQSVALVGNFNNWDKEYDFMYPIEGGGYEFIISLNRGVYQYKFVVDGVEWIPDPNCSERCPDTLGGENSVLRVLT